MRGIGPEATIYLDLGCAHCAAAWGRLAALDLRLCFRHFPMARKHRRADALHRAAEAAARQSEEAFWGMVDATYADHGRQDDPHLWERVTQLGLDLERFDRDRRSTEVAQRVRRDFESGIRAGVAATPTAFVAGRPVTGDAVSSALAILARD